MLPGEYPFVARDGGFAGSGGFGFCVLAVDFVLVFDIRISDFQFGCGRRPRWVQSVHISTLSKLRP